MNTQLQRLNALSRTDAISELLACCGSSRWATEMADKLPFSRPDDMFDAADRIFSNLTDDDWLEAFRSHPKIGSKKAAVDTGAKAEQWSAREQAGAREASDDLLAEMTTANVEYERKFGYIFIVFATGKSVAEMLDLLRNRMHNNPGTELHVAAEEQRKITRLRLERFLEL